MRSWTLVIDCCQLMQALKSGNPKDRPTMSWSTTASSKPGRQRMLNLSKSTWPASLVYNMSCRRAQQGNCSKSIHSTIGTLRIFTTNHGLTWLSQWLWLPHICTRAYAYTPITRTRTHTLTHAHARAIHKNAHADTHKHAIAHVLAGPHTCYWCKSWSHKECCGCSLRHLPSLGSRCQEPRWSGPMQRSGRACHDDPGDWLSDTRP